MRRGFLTPQMIQDENVQLKEFMLDPSLLCPPSLDFLRVGEDEWVSHCGVGCFTFSWCPGWGG